LAFGSTHRAIAQEPEPAAAPALAPLPDTPHAGLGHRVELRGVSQGVSFYVVDDGAAARRLCGGECTLTLSPGTYRFALSQGASDPIEAVRLVDVAGPTTVDGLYTSNEGTRLLGGFVLVTTLLSGVSSSAVGAVLLAGASDGSEEAGIGAGTLAGGILISLVGAIVGGVMMGADDEVAVHAR
jgi:hypothetical protein